MNDIPRPEYPRPQLVRDSWINLNGQWQFEIDHGSSGRARGLVEGGNLSGLITVPFCPESRLSGVEYKDFMAAVWYKRHFDLPQSWDGRRVLLHFGAVDYATEAWINGISVGTHKGGYSSFSFDITDALRAGANTLTVCAEDDVRSGRQPRGKQSAEYFSHECDYTRTTGIWQTVWLEAVPQAYIAALKLTPDANNASVMAEVTFNTHIGSGRLTADARFGGSPAGKAAAAVSGRSVGLALQLSDIHLWEPGNPNLYDLTLTLETGGSVDKVASYFGLRSVSWDNRSLLINGKRIFQRLILDQGFFPGGVYTAPGDDDLRRDIELAMAMGFNGARLHQRAFEERTLYWADKLGYLVWGEYANESFCDDGRGLQYFIPEWLEVVERDYSHPSIIGWCPFNEIYWRANLDPDVQRNVYLITKRMDSTRPVIDSSGGMHFDTDMVDIHEYECDPAKFRALFDKMINDPNTIHNPLHQPMLDKTQYRGQPYWVSEYGGIWWDPNPHNDNAWGYDRHPETEEIFMERFKGLTEALLDNPRICGFCYTQLTDVEQEVNGLLTFERNPKFDMGVLRQITAKRAAIEEQGC